MIINEKWVAADNCCEAIRDKGDKRKKTNK